MISAMPAVAVRRERRKKMARAASLASSRQSSVSSLSQSRPGSQAGRRPTTPSISTISSSSQPSYVSTITLHRRTRDPHEIEKQKLKFLMRIGTILIASGIVLVFISVAISIPGTQKIGFVFIGIGCILCLIKVVFSTSQTPTVKKLAATKSGSAAYMPPSTVTTPASEDSEFTSLLSRRLPLSPSQETNLTVHTTHTCSTPISLNSIPEMQILVTDERERY